MMPLENAIAEHLGKVTLSSPDLHGSIPLFGNTTHSLSKSQVDYLLLQVGITDGYLVCSEQSKSSAHLWVEAAAKIGALITTLTGHDGIFYNIGGGIGIESLAFSKLSGGKSVSVDIHPHPFSVGRKYAKDLRANVNYVKGDALELVSVQDVKPDDVVAFIFPTRSIADYWKRFLDRGCAIVIANEVDRLNDDYLPGTIFRRNNADKFTRRFEERFFKKSGYRVQSYSIPYHPSFLLVVAQRTGSR